MLERRLDSSARNGLRIVEKYDSSQKEVTISLAGVDLVLGETELILEHQKDEGVEPLRQ